ncbi:unnamed protein product [Closterium sp. Naga37s-1]|nr:unnamed protein product [Closterium sp. Naga37s-1]
MDMLPASLWHRVFRCLLLPPGSSHSENPLVHSRRKTPWYLTATTQPPAGRILPVKFVDPDFTAVGQHRKNAKSYGSGWALLCCAMASKRLLTLVLSFSVSAALSVLDLMFGRPRLSLALTYTHIILLSHFHIPSSIHTHPSLPAQHPICLAQHPISLVYNDLHPQWERSVAFFLRWRGLRSLALTYTHIMQLHTLCSQAEWPSGEVTEEKGHLRWACGSLALTYTHIMQLHTLCSQAECCTRSARRPSGEVTEEKGHLRWACGSLALTYTHIMQLNTLCSQAECSTRSARRPSGEVTEEKGHLRWACGSLALTYTHIMQLNMLCSQDQWQFSSLTSLSLKLRGCVDSAQQFDTVEQGDRDEVEEEYWTQYFDCPRLQRLKLGRGKGVLQNGWADEFKALRSLTLKHVDWSYVDFKHLTTITLRLTEFTLYERWNLDEASSGPRSDGSSRFCFDCSSARVLRFFFAQSSLTLFLTLSRSLKAFSAVAKRLVLSCKSTLPLYLHHLSLYGQERLIISSLPIASAREAYLNGPPRDWHSRDDASSSHWATPAPPPGWLNSHRSSSPEFSWVAWLGAIARTVEVLIVRHGVPVEKVEAEWS